MVGLALAAGLAVTVVDATGAGRAEAIADSGGIDEVAAVDAVNGALEGPDLCAWVVGVQLTSRPTHPVSATNLNAPTTAPLSSTIIWSLG
ncbi:MAG TPA: hypothetical protein VII50_00775 [Acidothermaceae bacterium]